MSNNRPIGFIDSGVGGLTVVKEAMKQLPHEEIMYLGDTARCPYGPRPVEEVKAYTWQMTHYLLKKDIKMLVIACNTATAVVLKDIQEALDIPVVGVIAPGSHAALKHTKNNKIGIIATEMTVKQEAYGKAIRDQSAETHVFEVACPKFVPLVETQQANSPKAKMIVAESLKVFNNCDIDTLVLGCTHYPLLKKNIQNYVGNKVTLIDSGAETVNVVSFLLEYSKISADSDRIKPQHQFYTTSDVKTFKAISEEWLGQRHIPVAQIEIETEKEMAE